MADEINGMISPDRIYTLNDVQLTEGPVVYWMNRDLRVTDNWALLYTSDLARRLKSGLVAAVCLNKKSVYANPAQRELQKSVLPEIKAKLKALNIVLVFGETDPVTFISGIIKKVRAAVLVTEFFPLKPVRTEVQKIIDKTRIAAIEIDSHNIVPCRTASEKLEFAARTIRPKIMKKLNAYLTEFPKLKKLPEQLSADFTGQIIVQNRTGASAIGQSHKLLQNFISKNIFRYDSDRNDPNLDGQSGLSPYLHSGIISAQRVVLDLTSSLEPDDNLDKFLDEIVVRRELSDNFCHYNFNYDNFDGFPDWAKQTLNEHRKDIREYVYHRDQFERADTHDELWNAAQTELMVTGKMHGYMRMYWAKKILEWTKSPEQAQAVAIYLNDRYSLDGNDPNGFAGVAWSIGGVHDRPWTERPVFGKIRYMNYNGCRRKFDVAGYVERIIQKANSTSK